MDVPLTPCSTPPMNWKRRFKNSRKNSGAYASEGKDDWTQTTSTVRALRIKLFRMFRVKYSVGIHRSNRYVAATEARYSVGIDCLDCVVRAALTSISSRGTVTALILSKRASTYATHQSHSFKTRSTLPLNRCSSQMSALCKERRKISCKVI